MRKATLLLLVATIAAAPADPEAGGPAGPADYADEANWLCLPGRDDACASPERLAGWQAYTTQPLRMRHVPGGHFYLEERIDEVAAILRETFVQALRSPDARNAA